MKRRTGSRKQLALGLALLPTLCLASHANAQATVESRLSDALAMEWYYSNCPNGGNMNAMVFMSISMTINGHTATDIVTARQKVRDQIQSRYPNVADACAEFDKLQKQASPTPPQ